MEETYENMYNQICSELELHQALIDAIFKYIEEHPNVKELEDIFNIIKDYNC